MIQNILFDFDGTLVDSAGDIVYCLKSAYKLAGVNCGVQINETFIGPPLNEILHSVTPSISQEEEELVVSYFRNCYDRSEYPCSVLYEGVRELLVALKHNNKLLFIVTNKPGKPTRKIISSLGIDCFDEIICIDSHNEDKSSKSAIISWLVNKMNLNKDSTVVVGDSVDDICAARNNGLISIAVLSGYGNASAIKENKPDYILNETKDLLGLVNTIESKN